MIIERIRKINNIGTYEKAGDGRIRLQPLTYIYALNTYGKTTFCDILRSFKNNDVSIINNRRRIGCSPSERCEVELTINGENVTFDGQCWNVPAAVDIREQLQIFDINFVNENIFTNFNIEHRNKENFTSFVLGTRGVELIQLLDAMETDLASKEQDAKAKKTTLEKMLGGVTFDELKKIKYQESFKEVECLIISAKEGIKELKKQKTEIDKIKGLKGIDLLNMNFDKLVLFIETIQEELKK